MQTPLPDGEYLDLISGQEITMSAGGALPAPASALMLRYAGQIDSSQPMQETVIL